MKARLKAGRWPSCSVSARTPSQSKSMASSLAESEVSLLVCWSEEEGDEDKGGKEEESGIAVAIAPSGVEIKIRPCGRTL